jgi:hypothetical protein
LIPGDPHSGRSGSLILSDPHSGRSGSLILSDPHSGRSGSLIPSDPHSGRSGSLIPSDPVLTGPSCRPYVSTTRPVVPVRWASGVSWTVHPVDSQEFCPHSLPRCRNRAGSLFVLVVVELCLPTPRSGVAAGVVCNTVPLSAYRAILRLPRLYVARRLLQPASVDGTGYLAGVGRLVVAGRFLKAVVPLKAAALL